MPSKTKNRRNRNKTKNRRNTKGQRGGGFFSDLYDKLSAPDDPTVPKQSWTEWIGVGTDSGPKQSWSEWMGIKSTSAVDTVPTPNYSTPDYSTPNYSTPVSTPDYSTPVSTPVPDDTRYNGGKKSNSKSRRCNRKHKHSKYCKK
jgi:hypothetical protein